MRVIIDRIEEEFAVCEKDDTKMVNIELKNIPGKPKEGDVLDVEGSFIIINKSETAKRKAEIEEKSENLWK